MLSQVLLSPGDVADLIGLSRFTVLAMARRGELPAPIQLNARVLRFRAEDIAVRFGFDPACIAARVNQGPQQ
jgi:predicted DNA-binding transcriptional regulator AlpA